MAIGVVATQWALHPWRRALTPQAEALAQAIAARDDAVLSEVSVTADDGTTLRGWSIRPLHGKADAVILLHGVADNRMGMIGYADLLLRHGYAVLLPDARAHGESGGELATYGVKEAGDVRRWYDWVEQAERPRCIDGLGNSMGAALLLESLPAAPGFCAVVAESPFANFREASYDRLAERLGAGAWLGRTLLRPAVSLCALEVRAGPGAGIAGECRGGKQRSRAADSWTKRHESSFAPLGDDLGAQQESDSRTRALGARGSSPHGRSRRGAGGI